MSDSRNTILAVILSGLVLIGWQYFYNVPQMEKQRAAQQAQSELAKPAPQPGTATTPTTTPQAGGAPAPSASTPATNQPAAAAPVSRDTAIAAVPRVRIDTPRVSGSISLKGARIDDLSLVQFRETVDPSSPRSCCTRPRAPPSPITRNSAGCPRPVRP